MNEIQTESIYERINIIGKGGCATVELVRNKYNHELFARKRIYIRNNEEDEDRVEKEINLQKKIDHRNVVKIVDIEKERMPKSSCIGIIMEYAEGKDLRTYMDNLLNDEKWTTENAIIEMIIQISLGLESIHAKNIAHLDIKPSNILVFDKNILKVTDFGISKQLTWAISTQATKCSMAYAAPEIFENSKFHLEPDIWSLGCVLFELCTNMLPYTPWYKATKPLNTQLLNGYSPRLQNLIITHMLNREIKHRMNITNILMELMEILEEKKTNGSTLMGIQNIKLCSIPNKELQTQKAAIKKSDEEFTLINLNSTIVEFNDLEHLEQEIEELKGKMDKTGTQINLKLDNSTYIKREYNQILKYREIRITIYRQCPTKIYLCKFQKCFNFSGKTNIPQIENNSDLSITNIVVKPPSEISRQSSNNEEIKSDSQPTSTKANIQSESQNLRQEVSSPVGNIHHKKDLSLSQKSNNFRKLKNLRIYKQIDDGLMERHKIKVENINSEIIYTCKKCEFKGTPSDIMNHLTTTHNYKNYCLFLLILFSLSIITNMAICILYFKDTNDDNSKCCDLSESSGTKISNLDADCYENIMNLKHIIQAQTQEQKLITSKNKDYPKPNLRETAINTKDELILAQNSAQAFGFKMQYIFLFTIPTTLSFYSITSTQGIKLFSGSNNYCWAVNSMIANEDSGAHGRGQMNWDGIYIVAGASSNNVKIYFMNYYDQANQRIKLLRTFPHSFPVQECFYKTSETAICCDEGGYIIAYDLADPNSIPFPSVFNTTELDSIYSCILTQNKKYIIAGNNRKLYIINAKDGSLQKTHNYLPNEGNHAIQIAEVRPNILMTADYSAVYIHDITDITNMPDSVKLEENPYLYYSIISLQSNTGDIAFGGKRINDGFVSLCNLKDNKDIACTYGFIDSYKTGCNIKTIKELRKGTILFGGSGCERWNYWNYDSSLGKPVINHFDEDYITGFVAIPQQNFYSSNLFYI